jgi:hypothetical protein
MPRKWTSWKDWVVIVTVVVNVTSLLLRVELRTLVTSGWTWLYVLSLLIVVIYLLDAYKRARAWLEDFQRRMLELRLGHKQWYEQACKDWEQGRADWEREFGRQLARQIEDAVRPKADLASLKAESETRQKADEYLHERIDKLNR